MFEEKIWTIDEKTDIIVLPEMFSTGFTMETEKVAEPQNSKTYRWMAQMAAQTGALVVGSYIIKEGKDSFNRLYCVNPEGRYYVYDKRHLFRMAEENLHFAGGSKKEIVDWKGWKILPLVCYDLRFPVWSRNRVLEGSLEYDAILYIANWPQARVEAWDTLLRARAIENLSYSIGLNRVGEDGNAIKYNGHSAIYDYKGDQLLFIDDKEELKTTTLSYEHLITYREKFPAHHDGDAFEIKY
jgi:predicted amidohydrolase